MGAGGLPGVSCSAIEYCSLLVVRQSNIVLCWLFGNQIPISLTEVSHLEVRRGVHAEVRRGVPWYSIAERFSGEQGGGSARGRGKGFLGEVLPQPSSSSLLLSSLELSDTQVYEP